MYGTNPRQNLAFKALQTRVGAHKRSSFKPEPYRFDPTRYVRECLKWEPWGAHPDYPDHPGQVEVYEHYALVLKQLQERRDFGLKRITEAQLTVWRPGIVIQNWIRIEAATSVGKTRLASGFVNHLFDCFKPSIVYVIAPSYDQVHDLTFKEIKATREGKGLPGKIMDLRLELAEDHFVVGKATKNAEGTGLERIKGQHAPHMGHVIEEADGVEDFIWDGVEQMDKGFTVVIAIANPRSRQSKFHKIRSKAKVKNFRIDALHHPNVLGEAELIPGSVTRDEVEEMLAEHCFVVDQHNSDVDTFECPWRPGVIYQPDDYFRTNYLGCPPSGSEDLIFVPLGRYEEACHREIPEDDPTIARIGIDVARDGPDKGTIWYRHGDVIARHARFSKQHNPAYAASVRELCEMLLATGARNVQIRVDNGGGYGGGVADLLDTEEFRAMFSGEGKQEKDGWAYSVIMVNFGGKPSSQNRKKYADRITEMFAEVAEVLRGVKIFQPPAELEGDLTMRRYKWEVGKSGKEVKIAEPKDSFKKRQGRSPDDGDGFLLAASPDYIFDAAEWYWA